MNGPFETVVGQAEAVDLLGRILRRSPDIPTSYIFHGPEGSGKRLTALRFAAALTGQDPDRIASGLAPDLLLLDEAGPNIKLEAVQQLIWALGLRPAAASCKVAVIDDAETMTREAANALLKTLEEPPPTARLVLVTSRLDEILPTVRSRCLRIRFRRLSAETVRDLILRSHPDTPPEVAWETALLSGGSMSVALDLLGSENRRAAERLAKEALRIWADRRTTAADIVRASEPLQRAGPEGRLIFGHLLDILTLHWRERLVSEPAALAVLDLIAGIRKDLETNANLRLAFEHLLRETRRILGT